MAASGLAVGASQMTRAQRGTFVVVMVAAALMPAVPDSLGPEVVVFTAAYVVFFALAFGPRLFRPSTIYPWNPGVMLAAFLGCMALSLPIALVGVVQFGAWFRGAIPFSFLTIYFAFPRRMERSDSLFVLRVLVGALILWLVKMAFLTFGEFFAGDIGRLTYLHRDYQLPFALVGFLFCLFPLPRQHILVSVVFGIFCAFVIIGSGYRSQAGLAILALLIFVWRLPIVSKIIFIAVVVVASIVALIQLQDTQFAKEYIARFEDMGSEATIVSRKLERAYGIDRFLESPLFGNGLGYPVPFRLQQDIPGSEEERPANGEDWVGYIHNVWVYMLMDLGILGLLSYVGFLTGGIIVAFLRGRDGDLLFGAGVSVILLLLYFSVEAAFRLIQNNLLLGILTAVLAKTSRARQSGRTVSGGAAQ